MNENKYNTRIRQAVSDMFVSYSKQRKTLLDEYGEEERVLETKNVSYLMLHTNHLKQNMNC